MASDRDRTPYRFFYRVHNRTLWIIAVCRQRETL